MGKDDLLFQDDVFPSDESAETPAAEQKPGSQKEHRWKLLIVDDEQEVHSTTKLVLDDFSFEGDGLEFHSAYSSKEAIAVMREHDDIAVILLDVVMESPSAGLECVKAIRKDLGNKLVRIVLRTGQPGQAPERTVIVDYDINDYKNKAEITSQRLFTAVYTAIRSYRDMRSIERQRVGLKYIIDASSNFFQQQSIQKLAKGVLTQIEALFSLENSIYLRSAGFSTVPSEENADSLNFITGTGKYEDCDELEQCHLLTPEVSERIRQVASVRKGMFFGNDFVGYFPTQNKNRHILYMEDCDRENWEEVQELIEIFTTNVGIALDNVYLNQEIMDTQAEVVVQLGEVVESRSKETAYHVRRVAEYSRILALGWGMNEPQAELVRLASPMHDIGKIGIPDSILLKPGRLDDEEMEVMRTHAEIGHKILQVSQRPLMQTAASLAYTHHERWDGGGYPRGLSGEAIPIEGRITCLADIFDALACKRVYKDAWPLEQVFDFLRDNSGTIFDPNLIDIFFARKDEILAVRENYRDEAMG